MDELNEHGQRVHGRCPNCRYYGKACLCWFVSRIDADKAVRAIRDIYDALHLELIGPRSTPTLNPSKALDTNTIERVAELVHQVIPRPIEEVSLTEDRSAKFEAPETNFYLMEYERSLRGSRQLFRDIIRVSDESTAREMWINERWALYAETKKAFKSLGGKIDLKKWQVKTGRNKGMGYEDEIQTLKSVLRITIHKPDEEAIALARTNAAPDLDGIQ